MATVEFQGYVNRPEAKTSKNGKSFSKYTVGVKQKDKAYGDKPETVTWANFFVTDFENSSPPPEKSFVRITGYLKVVEKETNGAKRTFLEVTAKTVEVVGNDSAPKAAPAPASDTPEKDPWE